MAQPTNHPSLLSHAPWVAQRYAAYAGDQERVLRAICYTLSERFNQVAWDELDGDDWVLLGHMAEGERVGPLLHYLFKSEFGFPTTLPDAVRARLHQQALRTAVHNKLLFAELERVLAALDEAGIPVIVLKGAALAHTVYPDPSVRPMTDLDILIPESMVEPSRYALIEAGYVQDQQAATFDAFIAHHLIFRRGAPTSGSPVPVEMHWSLIGGPYDWRTPDVQWMWQHCAPGDRSSRMQTLNPEATILLLCAHHALQHRATEHMLQSLWDLYAVMIRFAPVLDWETIEAKACEFEWGAAVREVSISADALFGAGLPQDTRHRLARVVSSRREEAWVSRNQTSQQRGLWVLALRGLSWRWLLMIRPILFPTKRHLETRYGATPHEHTASRLIRHWSGGVKQMMNAAKSSRRTDAGP